MLQTAPPFVRIELLVGLFALFIVVLTTYGALVKSIYDRTMSMDHLLRGTNGTPGFVSEMRQSHDDIDDALRAHAMLLEEIVIVMRDDERDVSRERLEYLEQFLSTERSVSSRPEYRVDDEDRADER